MPVGGYNPNTPKPLYTPGLPTGPAPKPGTVAKPGTPTVAPVQTGTTTPSSVQTETTLPAPTEITTEAKVEADKKEDTKPTDTVKPAPPKRAATTEIISDINELVPYGIMRAKVEAGKLFDQGKQVANQANLSQAQLATVQRAAQTTPTTFNKGLQNFAVAQMLTLIDNLAMKYKNSLRPGVPETAKKILALINANGRFDPSELKDDAEAFKVINDETSLRQVLGLLQEATDKFMEVAQTQIADKRRTIQQKAQTTLDIAAVVIQAEKDVRGLQVYNDVKLGLLDLTLIAEV